MSEPAESLPPVAVLRADIEGRGWKPVGHGPVGSLYVPPDGGAAVGIPSGDTDQLFLRGAIESVAEKEHLPFGRYLALLRKDMPENALASELARRVRDDENPFDLAGRQYAIAGCETTPGREDRDEDRETICLRRDDGRFFRAGITVTLTPAGNDHGA